MVAVQTPGGGCIDLLSGTVQRRECSQQPAGESVVFMDDADAGTDNSSSDGDGSSSDEDGLYTDIAEIESIRASRHAVGGTYGGIEEIGNTSVSSIYEGFGVDPLAAGT